jgi:VWFA-related protein
MSPIRRGGSAAGVVAALILTGSAAGRGDAGTPQADVAQFRSTADLVSVYATVLDRQGQFVRDLARDDFEVEDNGRRQPIAVFSSDRQPFTAVLMLDCSGSMAPSADLVRQGAGVFVDRLIAGDRARIGNFGMEIRITPSLFTEDHVILRQVIDTDLQDEGPSPVWTAVDRSISALRAEPGRKVILLFSDGHDAPSVGQITTDVKDVIHRARYNGILVYVIAFPRYDMRPAIFAPDRDGVLNLLQRPVETRKPHGALKTLASETGGGYLELGPTDALDAAFARVADDLHHQYWLGFAAPALDGRVHSIDVKVRRSGVTVRARKSYVADPRR